MDEVRDSIGVGNGGLGLALLGGGLGGILGSVVGGRVLRPGLILKVLRWSMTGLAITLPIIAFVPNAASLLVLLTMLGFCDVLDVEFGIRHRNPDRLGHVGARHSAQGPSRHRGADPPDRLCPLRVGT
ncbi:MAG: hypothetical protein EBT21_02305 [Actinobacteria bacterium]|nr:hypothetical protein [Actinomycetota bacterium]